MLYSSNENIKLSQQANSSNAVIFKLLKCSKWQGVDILSDSIAVSSLKLLIVEKMNFSTTFDFEIVIINPENHSGSELSSASPVY